MTLDERVGAGRAPAAARSSSGPDDPGMHPLSPVGDGEQGPLEYLLAHIGDLKRRLQLAHHRTYAQRRRAEHWRRVALRKQASRGR